MAKVTVQKNNNFTVISNDIFKDTRLSCKAKGLLVTMLSCPPEWNYTVDGLTKLSLDDRASIRSTLNELETFGYLDRRRVKDKKGRFADVEYTIYEAPQQNTKTFLENNKSKKPKKGKKEIHTKVIIPKAPKEFLLNPEKNFADYKTKQDKIKTVMYRPNLNNEEIRKEINSMKYSDFLKTPYWEGVRQYKLQKAGYKC